MSLPVLTAVSGPWEAALVAGLGGAADDVHVARRCADLSELLSAADAGLGRAALVSADLPRLDLDAVARLVGAGVAVVGVTDPADPAAGPRLADLGVRRVLPAGASPDEVVALVTAAVAALPEDAAVLVALGARAHGGRHR
jgi:DNA-binding NarL/FixJ family response regulator